MKKNKDLLYFQRIAANPEGALVLLKMMQILAEHASGSCSDEFAKVLESIPDSKFHDEIFDENEPLVLPTLMREILG